MSQQIYGPNELASPQPKNFNTGSRTKTLAIVNTSYLSLEVMTEGDSVTVPPYAVAYLPASPAMPYFVTSSAAGANNPSYPVQSVVALESDRRWAPGIRQLATGGLGAGKPVLVATFPYSAFSASTTYYPYIAGKFSRLAVARTFILYNTMNEAVGTTVGFYPYDSSIVQSPSNIAGGFTWTATIAATSGVLTLSSQLASAGNAGLLTAAVDSFQLSLPMGATAPTSGDLYVYVVEQLGG